MNSPLQTYFESEGFENFKRALYLTEEESLRDPENNPYKSQYEARKLLQEILDKVHKEREENQDDLVMLMLEACLQYYVGTNYIHTEERPAGEECLYKCLKLLKGTEVKTEIVSVALSAHSELGILWSSRYQGAEKALKHLEDAVQLHDRYWREVGVPPLAISELLQSTEKHLSDCEREKKSGKIYTHILFYLAQVHKNLGNSDLSAKYCQQTLRRQLEAEEYEPKEWAVNSAALSQYYISHNMFFQAKHCLSCANIIMEEAKPEEDLGDPTPDEDADTTRRRNAIPQRKADIARCWVKYFISLLEYSKEQLYNDVCELDANLQRQAISQLSLDRKDEGDVPKDQERMPLEVDSVEEQVRHHPVTTFEEARDVYLMGKKYVDAALIFFVMDGYVTDNIELHQDMSTLYKNIVFFETDKDRKCKMHKRRIDLLSKVLGEINPQFYLLICRQLQFELGETYSEMLDLKVGIANASDQSMTLHAIKKINMLCRSSIKCFSSFLDTLKTLKKVFPDKFDDDVEHPAIIATFYLARLHSKIIAPVKSEKLQFLQESLNHYQWIVDYVERNPSCEPTVQKEVEICREMTVLMPKSMERYREE